MTARLLSTSSKNYAEPRFETLRDPTRQTVGHQVIAIADKLGTPFMPWQAAWSLVVGEIVIDEDLGIPVPAYPEAFLTVMRQQGKTLWLFAEYLQRANLWEAWDRKPQAIAYTAQSAIDAYKKFTKEHLPLLRRSPLYSLIKKERHTAGDRGLTFNNGADMTIWASTQEAGHGATIDMGILDEIFADQDDRREQAIGPAMNTRHDQQTLLASTGGTDESALYNRKQKAGRAAVLEGRTTGMAYLEYAADPEARDFDPESHDLWRQVMPALGYTVSIRTVQAALDRMRKLEGQDNGLREFMRAYLNIPLVQSSVGRAIPKAEWSRIQGDVSPGQPCVLAVDSQPDQATASVAMVDEQFRAEVVAHRAGIGWLMQFLEAEVAKTSAAVVLEAGGPVGSLIPALEKQGIQVVKLTGGDVAHCCAETLSRILDARMGVRPTVCAHCQEAIIHSAAKHAVKVSRDSGWRWARTSVQADISPLMAMSMGVGAVAGIGGWEPGGGVLFDWAE